LLFLHSINHPSLITLLPQLLVDKVLKRKNEQARQRPKPGLELLVQLAPQNTS
jgi:hypothetical protein